MPRPSTRMVAGAARASALELAATTRPAVLVAGRAADAVARSGHTAVGSRHDLLILAVPAGELAQLESALADVIDLRRG